MTVRVQVDAFDAGTPRCTQAYEREAARRGVLAL